MKLSTSGAPTATLIARSIALVAFLLMLCGCTVHEEPQPSAARRQVDVKVNIDLNRRPVCPDGKCPLRQAGCDCGCTGDCDCCGGWGRSWPGAASLSLKDVAGQRCPGWAATGASPRQRQPAKAAVTRGSAPATSCNLKSNPHAPGEDPKSESPVMNLPENARCKNYGGGSCVCASTISLLRWQGRDDLAAGLRNTCLGGQSSASLHARLERLGVRWASTTAGDVAFLEWAVRTRRGCGITFYPMHYVNLVDLTAEQATLLDNNRVGAYITIPRDEFIRRWRGYGGWATAVVYSPAAPLARR